ncbi:MAG: Dockerin type domain [Planctomycetota bacterium]|jgi:hypothetical protein
MQIQNTDSTRSNPLATMILGLGAAVGIALSTPALAAQKHYSIKPTADVKVVLSAETIEKGVAMPKRKPRPQPEATAEKGISSLLPPDPCAAGPKEYDCNQNGINDICDIADGWADANKDGILDFCQLAAGDLNLDGAVDARDLVTVLNDWGTEGSDTNGDGIVDGFDLAAVLSNWSN